MVPNELRSPQDGTAGGDGQTSRMLYELVEGVLITEKQLMQVGMGGEGGEGGESS